MEDELGHKPIDDLYDFERNELSRLNKKRVNELIKEIQETSRKEIEEKEEE